MLLVVLSIPLLVLVAVPIFLMFFSETPAERERERRQARVDRYEAEVLGPR